MDYQKEVETFRSKLQEAREKFNHWTGDELRQLTQDLALTSSKLLQDSLGWSKYLGFNTCIAMGCYPESEFVQFQAF